MTIWPELTLGDKVSLLNMIEQTIRKHTPALKDEGFLATADVIVEEIAEILTSLDVAVTDLDISGAVSKYLSKEDSRYLYSRLDRRLPDHFIPYVNYRV